MAINNDLIDFDIIESHKENIQSLPSGRSARALVNILSPQPSSGAGAPAKSFSPCDSDTKNLNDAIRQEYEIELQSIAESDDPLDVFDRYVKWTLNAYPSAQATPQSQLLPLLERATKAFLGSAHYKNDPRYLKLWLHYIRFFSDSPRETFAFLARHKIGEGLALYYEEFSAWLEGAGRWNQAEEVYKLGIEREARPTERLMRKYAQFQQRYEARPQNADEPSSPALPTVRPALAARIDPFASSTPTSNDPQAQPPSSGLGSTGTASRSGKPKMAIFSDADGAAPPEQPPIGAQTKGWESIGSLRDRRKENTIEAKPWVGETLKGGSKRAGHAEKMEIFKDQLSQVQESIPFQSSHPDQAVINPKTGRAERVFVNLEAVYPNQSDPSLEMSFEELRAARRGWSSKSWRRNTPPKALRESAGNKQQQHQQPENTIHIGKLSRVDELAQDLKNKASLSDNATETLSSFDEGKPEKQQKSKKMKVREIKQETQTIKANLESPTGPKIRRKNSSEPTMTFHSKAATDEIYSIFNQPLKCEEPTKDDTVSDGGDSDEDDDDYTSAGESTGTGRISGTTSEFGDEETANSAKLSAVGIDENDTRGHNFSGGEGASEWTTFSASKHVPNLDGHQSDEDLSEVIVQEHTPELDRETRSEERDSMDDENEKELREELVTPVLLSEVQEESHSTRFIPVPPEDYEPPTHPYRDPAQVANNRLPFMTPIVEKTESSLALSTAAPFTQPKDYFNSKTPSRSNNAQASTSELPGNINDLLLSSPFQDVVTPEKKKTNKSKAEARDDEGSPAKKLKLVIARSPQAKAAKGPVIKDLQVNPCDEIVRSTITKSLYPPLSSYPGFHDHETESSNRSGEIRRYVKTLNDRKSKGNSERTQTHVMPPVLQLPGSSKLYAVKKELGKGAFAPVYLVECMDAEHGDNESGEVATEVAALKMEAPPTSWEFLILRTLHSRLGSSSRTVLSLIQAHECHLYRDECFLILDYSDQGTLLDLVNLFRTDNIRNGKSADTGIDEPLAMFFAIELFRVLEESHRAGIIHGDLKADNCLVRLDPNTVIDSPYNPQGHDGWSSKGFTLIDFGRGIDMRKFRPEAQFIADWETGPQDCAEMRELRPWTWQADYFGLAGIIHSLLFGKYIETVVDKSAASSDGGPVGGGGGIGAKKVWKLKEGFKRYWQGGIWNEVFWTLLNPTIVPMEGGMIGELEKMPLNRSMKKCREMMEQWLIEEGERKGLRNLITKAERMVKEARRK